MPISFNEIPNTNRTPFIYVEFDNSRAVQGPTQMPYKALVTGQKLGTGTQNSLEAVRVTNAGEADALFGAGSQLALMLGAWFDNNNVTETWAIALDDAAGSVAAAGVINFIGTATESGTIALYIGGFLIKIPVATGDTGTVLTARAASLISAESALPLTAVVNGVVDTTLDLTAKNKGTTGNDIDTRLNYLTGDKTPSGLVISLSDSLIGGATDPNIQDVINILGDEQYHIIVAPYTDAANLIAIEAELADRWTALRMIEGHAFTAASGTQSALGTLGDTRNSQHLTIVGAGKSPTHPAQWAAAVAAVAAFYGNLDPARPFQTLPIKSVLPPISGEAFTMQENNLLLHDGISTYRVAAGGNVVIERLVTTYKTNGFGAVDISYLDVNTMLTLSFLRFDFRNTMLRKYPRHKLADDGKRIGAGQAVMTPKLGKAEAVAIFRGWEELQLVENIDQFKNDMIVERNASDPNRLDFLLPPDLINQFRVAGVQIQFLL